MEINGNYKILIVEDDDQIAQAIEKKMAGWNLNVHRLKEFDRVLEIFEKLQPHLVIMDISLPFFDGYYWCEQIRKQSRVPILFISSANENLNTILALHAGGDDFVAKPFDLDVLLAKIQAMLRRSYDFNTSVSWLIYRDLSLNLDEQNAHWKGQKLDLSKNEFRILQVLMENKEKVISREMLMNRLWKTQQFVDDNTLSVNVNRLRRKLERAGCFNLIHTKVGQGYILQMD